MCCTRVDWEAVSSGKGHSAWLGSPPNLCVYEFSRGIWSDLLIRETNIQIENKDMKGSKVSFHYGPTESHDWTHNFVRLSDFEASFSGGWLEEN